MRLPGDELVAVIVAISFAAGLNLYATTVTLGLLARAGLLSLPPTLQLLASWYVIAISGALFLVEFFADKIPAFDLVWNALHTFIRVPVAALLAYRASAALPPWEQLAAVTPSPEPFSNIALSFGEDVLAVFLTWFATGHPYWAAGIAAVFVGITVALVRWVVRAVRGLFRGAELALVK
jgi:Domain of unknown function (DUF4126)